MSAGLAIVVSEQEASSFKLALEAASAAVELFEGGHEDTHDFHVKSDENLSAIGIKDFTIYIKEGGPNRVMDGTILVGSFLDPVEAVIETIGFIVANRTKEVLKEHLQSS